MNYSLPNTVTVGGEEYAIRADFRVILTILEILSDPDLDNQLKAKGLLELFYLQPPTANIREAITACYNFIDMESGSKKKSPRVMDWEQDFRFVVAPVNRVLGYECRNVPYDYEANTGGLHWWTFMAAYMEIGIDCMFSQIVSIRDKQARGKKLEKHEKEFFSRNRDIITLRQKLSEKENDLAAEWMNTGRKQNG